MKVLLYYQVGQNSLPTLVSETPSSTYANIVIPKKTLTNGLTLIKGIPISRLLIIEFILGHL